jgi:3-hydroxyisobutyrate dehydrogenase
MTDRAGDRVGFVGLGIMGSRMAANLRRAGFEVTVWNRTVEKAEIWAREHGGELAASPAAVAEASDVVITMVVDGGQVESVLLGDDGVADGARDGLLCVDMSTIGPSEAQRIGAALAERGPRFMDAPVTGSSPKAEDGTLTIMAGGEREDFERAKPLFEVMGELVVHAGPLGHGQMVKVINNTVGAINTAVAAEALLVGKQAGLDLDALVTVMRGGSGGSVMLDLKAEPMLSHDYTTLFKLAHMLKDVRLCREAAKAVGGGPLMEFLEPVERILAEADEQGLGEADFAALLEVLEQRAGTRL